MLTFLPVHMLLGFSVELLLKAWLRHAGIEESELRRAPFGHSLQNLYETARNRCLPTIPRLDAVISLLHGSHSDFTYRYFRSEGEYTTMDFGNLFRVLDALDMEVDRFIGASASRGLPPGH